MSAALVRVLLVEDDRAAADAVGSYLARDGFLVDVVSDGLAARDAVAAWAKDYGLFIVDLNLPGLSGERVCLAIRSRTSAPVIVVSGKAGVDSAVASIELGADDFLGKPFSPRELVARVHAKLRHGAGREADVRAASTGIVLDPSRLAARIAGEEYPLGREEYAVLSALTRAGGSWVPWGELAEAARVAPHSLTAVAKSLRASLAGSPASVSFAHGKGFRLVVDAEP